MNWTNCKRFAESLARLLVFFGLGVLTGVAGDNWGWQFGLVRFGFIAFGIGALLIALSGACKDES